MPITVSPEHTNERQDDDASSPLAERLREAYVIVVSLLRARNFAQRVRGQYVASPIKQAAALLLREIEVEIQTGSQWLRTEKTAVDMLEVCVEVVDYYDDLQEPRYAWLSALTGTYYEELVGRLVGAERLLACFRLALIHLQLDYRRRPLEPRLLEEKFAHLEPCVARLYGTGQAQAYSAVRRYYDLRSRVVRQTLERYEADRFIDLATACADMEERLNEDNTGDILYQKMISIGLTRVWLQIAKGYYLHALELLKLVHAYLERYHNDPLTYAKYLVAKNICRRALAGKNVTELRLVIADLSEALRIFDELGDRRHLLRCYHERSLCFLLLGDHDQVEVDLAFMERFARVGGQDPSVGWQIQYHIMRSRLACRHGDHATALEKASEATSLAEKSGFDLLTIEAKNTLAMVFFRQGRLVESERLLREALRLNHDGLRQTDHGDLSQPALCGVSRLYLARVALLNNDTLAALTALQEWRSLSSRVEHQWVKGLAAEVEEQTLHRCLVEEVSAQPSKMDFPTQLRLLRKVSIERASRKLRSKKVVDIAKEINVNRQTIHYWLKDLKDQNIPVHLASNNLASSF